MDQLRVLEDLAVVHRSLLVQGPDLVPAQRVTEVSLGDVPQVVVVRGRTPDDVLGQIRRLRDSSRRRAQWCVRAARCGDIDGVGVHQVLVRGR
jgi:hypothetical protein